MLRDTSGEENTRLKAGLGRRLDHELLEQGVRTFPTFEETTTEDSLRLFKIGKLEARLIEILTKPSQSTDKRLTRLTNQTKLGGRFIRIVKEVEKL